MEGRVFWTGSIFEKFVGILRMSIPSEPHTHSYEDNQSFDRFYHHSECCNPTSGK
jgi:hypothetical protein